MVSRKILSHTTVFNIDSFLSTISILQWYLKDHVTLRDCSTGCEIFSIATTGISYILKYIKIKKTVVLKCNNILQILLFLLYFSAKKNRLGEHKRPISKVLKNLTDPKPNSFVCLLVMLAHIWVLGIPWPPGNKLKNTLWQCPGKCLHCFTSALPRRV